MVKAKNLALVFLLLVSLSFALNSAVVSADSLGSFTKYSTPRADMRSESMAIGPDGSLWFTEDYRRRIAKATTSGVITEYLLPSGYYFPENIISGPDGVLWFSARRENTSLTNLYSVGKITTSGSISMIDLPVPPGGSIINEATIAYSGGYIWVVRSYSAYIHRVSMDGAVSSIKMTIPAGTPTNETIPYVGQQILTDPNDGSLWIAARRRNPGNTTLGHYIENIKTDGSRTLHSLPYDGDDFHIIHHMTFDDQGKIWFIGGGNNGEGFGYINTSGLTSSYYSTISSNLRPRNITMGKDGNIWFSATRSGPTSGRIVQVNTTTSATTEYTVPSSFAANNPSPIIMAIDGNLWFVDYSSAALSKMGVGSVGSDDADDDGLDWTQELQQGTSDYMADSDKDGISDFIESIWNTDRDDIFCNSTVTNCAYPDPLRRDVYLEVDWMYRPTTPGQTGYSMQPTSTHLSPIKNAFAAKSINFHYDNGQYSGGEEVLYYPFLQFTPEESETDFYDYRDGTDGSDQYFANNRKDVWHYMISGYNYLESITSSGVALAGGDELFVSYGLLYESASGFGYSSFDTALAGTIMHELGHNLCLAPTQMYDEQSSNCVFQGIDNSGSGYDNYVSSMGYLYQLELVDYSDGSHGSGDHDDWSAISPKDFIYREGLEDIHAGITIAEAKKAREYRDKKGIRIVEENGKRRVVIPRNEKKE